MDTYDELLGTMDDNYRKYRVWLGKLDGFFVEKCTGCWNHSCPGCYDGVARDRCEIYHKEFDNR